MEKYQQILREAGYPTDTLTLDFESYYDSDYTLSKLGVIEYIDDPRFEFTGLGWGYDNGAHGFTPKEFVGTTIAMMREELGKNLEKTTVIVKNANFDIRILQKKFGFIPKYIIDVEDLSRFYDSRMRHDLDTLAKIFLGKEKGKTVQFKGLHYEDMDEDKRKALAEYCENDITLEFELFEYFIPYVSNPESEFWLMNHTLDMSLNPALDFDFNAADMLVVDMNNELNAQLDKVAWVEQPKKTVLKVLNTKLLFPQLLQAELPEGEDIPWKKGKPTKKMIEWSGKPGSIPALAKADKEFQELLVHPVQRVRELCQAKAAAKSWPTHIKKVEKMDRVAKCYGGKIPIMLKYYGAHTGRWTGTGGWNPLNLGGLGRAGSANHPLIRKVRGLLVAPDGYTLGICDSAQIECRILAWLAGEDKLI